jgi:hypothetical protein
MRAAISTMVALALAAIGLLIPAGQASASSGPSETAAVTIGRLQAEGYQVNIDRVGSAPLSDCAVTSVRNPQVQTRLLRVHGSGGHDHTIEVVTSRSISVSLDCSSR